MTTVSINLSKMFYEVEPYYCVNSVGALGPMCATLTWNNCLKVAERSAAWLLQSQCKRLMLTGVTEHLREEGYELEAIEDMDELELIAHFVWAVAHDLREYTDVDDAVFEELTFHDDDERGGLVHVIQSRGELLADYYLGV
jgi:hypothetical protein